MKPIKYLLNPCDIDRLPMLAPLGDWLAKFTPACPCCATVRTIAVSLVTLAVGIVFGAVAF